MKLNRNGNLTGMNRPKDYIPHSQAKNHPWKKTWTESPQGYQRALRNGFVLDKSVV